MWKTVWIASITMIALLGFVPVGASEPALLGWSERSPRDEIRPEFGWNPNGGPDGDGEFTIAADDRAGLMGWWEKQMAVEGGKSYRFRVARSTTDVESDRRTAVARIVWLDDNGKAVLRGSPAATSYRQGEPPRAEPEFPPVSETSGDWTHLAGTYVAPPHAKQARIELYFRWGQPHSTVRWSIPQLTERPAAAPRKVRLAAVHYQPKSGSTPQQKCEQFAPLIAEAAAQKVDLLVLPETLTYFGTPGTYADVAEPIPGPSTEYFAALAQQHNLYIVAGLIERDQHLIYNVAVLLSPTGELVGKYRKVSLPRSEIEGGITPGSDYPVFETRLGKIGMMVCYDGFFPEVARELSNRGAEIIAWPVWGCNPLLASARACENHVYLISSTYSDHKHNWMISAVYGHDGKPLAQAEHWGSLAIAEVDLAQPMYWHSLGDFRAQIQAHRPLVPAAR